MQGLSIYIIGLDNREKGFLPPEGEAVLEDCDYIFVSRRFAGRFEGVKERLFPFPDKLSLLPELIKEVVKKGDKEVIKIAILATGDPNFFGITPFVLRNFPSAEIKVFPNISTMQHAFARLSLNWDDAAFVTLHGRRVENLLPFFLKHKKGFLFTSNAEDVLFVLKCLKDNRLDDYTIYILENLGTEEEKIIKLTYPFLLKEPVADLNVVIFLRDVALGDYPGIGLPEERFKSVGGMITKREVRCNVISLLNLKEGLVLWDIGAGSGSVSIEATFNPIGTLAFAIEKDEEAYLNLKENIKTFLAYNVKPIFSDFLNVADKLPLPDRIFIGGGKIEENLPVAYERLKKRGILVTALLSADNLICALTFAREKEIPYELYQISYMRKVDLNGTNLLKGGNPVFLMRIQK